MVPCQLQLGVRGAPYSAWFTNIEHKHTTVPIESQVFYAPLEMDVYQKNIRLINHVTEFLDLDESKSNIVSEFISLVDALREGLQQVDEEFRMPDAQINILFLNKLKSRPEWKDWATDMLRHPRLSSSAPAGRMTFQELADLAIEREKLILGEEPPKRDSGGDHDTSGSSSPQPEIISTPHPLSQDEINAFVMRKMNEDKQNGQRANGPFKNPSQEEINEYVARQMRREQGRVTRTSSQSRPAVKSEEREQPRIRPRCSFCGDPSHPVDNCWRRWRYAAESQQYDFAPRAEFLTEFLADFPDHSPTYRNGFSPY